MTGEYKSWYTMYNKTKGVLQMYKCTKCNMVHSEKEWNEKTFGVGLVDKGVYDVLITECDDESKEYYGGQYIFDCPSCGDFGCFEHKEIIKIK
ncbi:hypothetical protein PQE70_gp020 [Bacillus phage vB_BanS_Nate]|uniref:Uncharacterized protein n=1 Tax=Bacillus phage vB_BanS_Nate TaxID=2894788 RepID=A0AAE8YU88_9CAUD|nr:hypothetical protein PQE70_gp020 [Bacillus phage vB_BanS_Nate]UGO50873.1 hypothetical protein NATE_20 [Bacillus phage vB_BanS_Nate]